MVFGNMNSRSGTGIAVAANALKGGKFHIQGEIESISGTLLFVLSMFCFCLWRIHVSYYTLWWRFWLDSGEFIRRGEGEDAVDGEHKTRGMRVRVCCDSWYVIIPFSSWLCVGCGSGVLQPASGLFRQAARKIWPGHSGETLPHIPWYAYVIQQIIYMYYLYLFTVCITIL
jgi:hypothetical protein